MDDYYQLSRYSFELAGTIVSADKITEADLIKGKMPENEYELVVDKKIIDNMLNNGYTSFSNMGIKSEDELLGKVVTITDMPDFKIVGFTNTNTDSIYVNKNLFINILNNMQQSEMGSGIFIDLIGQDSNASVKDYNLYLDDINETFKKW